MNYYTRNVENGTEIVVEADEAAVIVEDNGEERIYLPERNQQKSTYYTASTKELEASENGFKVVHDGVPDVVKVFSNSEGL